MPTNLSYWFRPGDEIFVFGFSRGAFTARSLCGYLHAVGLLKREHCNAENEARAWNYYRTPPDDRLSAEWLSFRQPLDQPERSLVHDDRYVRVRVLGVFDTVGALGIPALGFNRFNRSKYQFHDTDVKSTVDIRLHALAIDEPRPEFPPTLWTKPKFRVIDDKRSPTEQVWFPGAHSDIGGGYVKWNRLEIGLSHLTIAWMLQRLKHHLVSTPLLDEDPLPPPAVAPKRHAPLPFYMDDLIVGAKFAPKLKTLFAQHKPWSPQRMIRSASRVINQIALTDSEDAVAEGRVPYADPIGEMIHASALRRIKERVRVDSSFTPYLPKNLIGVIPYVAATYLKKHQIDTDWQCFVGRIFSWKQIRIVGWDGQPLDPDNQDDVTRAFQLLPDPARSWWARNQAKFGSWMNILPTLRTPEGRLPAFSIADAGGDGERARSDIARCQRGPRAYLHQSTLITKSVAISVDQCSLVAFGRFSN